MSTRREGFRSRSASLRWVSTALIMSAIRTHLTGKATRGAETRPVAATFRPAKNQSAAREPISQKFWRRSGNAGSDDGISQAEFEFEDAPRYDRKGDPDGARHRRKCPMLQT